MNKVKLEFSANSENVKLARILAAAYVTPLNATVDEISDIKTALSEAVTNSIIHGYDGGTEKDIVAVTFCCNEQELTIEVIDKGVGIKNVESAREPLFTTRPEMERSGLGFTVMESFMDKVELLKNDGGGVKLVMYKKIGAMKPGVRAAND